MGSWTTRLEVLAETMDWLREDRLRGNEDSEYAEAVLWLIGLLEDVRAHQVILRNYGSQGL